MQESKISKLIGKRELITRRTRTEKIAKKTERVRGSEIKRGRDR